jgi:basic membrane protein A and related proteins
MHRRIFLVTPLLLLIGGCSGPANQTTPPGGNAPSGSTSDFKVALVTVGALTDGGWNALAGEGLKRIETELGAKTAHQGVEKNEVEDAFRGFARDGYRLVIGHGSEFKDAAKAVAEEHPDTVFVVSSGDVQGANVASLQFDLGDASYLAGMAAAGMSKTGKGAQIGGEPFAPVAKAFELFEKGGQAINPTFRAPITYLGNWEDSNQAKEQALAMIRDGADVIFQNADAAGEGIFLAAEDNADKGVIVIGSNANQNDIKPQIIAASAVLDVAKTFLDVARDVKVGTFKGGIYKRDLASGYVYLAVNPLFEKKIPEAVREKIKQAEADIKSGKLKLVD